MLHAHGGGYIRMREVYMCVRVSHGTTFGVLCCHRAKCQAWDVSREKQATKKRKTKTTIIRETIVNRTKTLFLKIGKYMYFECMKA